MITLHHRYRYAMPCSKPTTIKEEFFQSKFKFIFSSSQDCCRDWFFSNWSRLIDAATLYNNNGVWHCHIVTNDTFYEYKKKRKKKISFLSPFFAMGVNTHNEFNPRKMIMEKNLINIFHFEKQKQKQKTQLTALLSQHLFFFLFSQHR